MQCDLKFLKEVQKPVFFTFFELLVESMSLLKWQSPSLKPVCYVTCLSHHARLHFKISAKQNKTKKKKKKTLQRPCHQVRKLDTTSSCHSQFTNWTPGKGYQGRDTWEGIPGKGYQGRDTKEGIPGKGYQGRDTQEGIPRKGYQGRDTKEGTGGGFYCHGK